MLRNTRGEESQKLPIKPSDFPRIQPHGYSTRGVDPTTTAEILGMVAKGLARPIKRTVCIKLSSEYAAWLCTPDTSGFNRVGCATFFDLSLAENEDHDAIDPRYLSAFLIYPALSLVRPAWSPHAPQSTPETWLRGKCDRWGKAWKAVSSLVLSLPCRSMQHGLIQPIPSWEGSR